MKDRKFGPLYVYGPHFPRIPTVKYITKVNLECYFFNKLNILHNICLKNSKKSKNMYDE